MFTTPTGPQDIYRAVKLLQQSGNLSRDTRSILHKAGKTIALANTKAAHLEAVYTQLQADHSIAKGHHKKKRIQVDPNERFATADLIVEAIRRLEEEEAKKVTPSAENTTEITEEIAAAQTLESMCFEWAL